MNTKTQRRPLTYTDEEIVQIIHAIKGLIPGKDLKPNRGCLEIVNYKPNTSGYYRITVGKKQIYIHRAAFITRWKRNIDPDLQIDHICKNKKCVNPDHLREVTNMVNNKESNSLIMKNMAKTECPNGHPLVGKNVGFSGRTRTRYCRSCNLARSTLGTACKKAGTSCATDSLKNLADAWCRFLVYGEDAPLFTTCEYAWQDIRYAPQMFDLNGNRVKVRA